MERIETDPESGAEIYRLVDDPRPADDVYGEQPYASADGEKVVVRFFARDGRDGALSILDLTDGSRRDVLDTEPRFPAFHGWGEYLYVQREAGDRLLLERCRYDAPGRETVASLPTDAGTFSYGTISRDHRYYAVSVHTEGASTVVLFDLERDERRTLIERSDREFKHEQFSRDGTNRLLVQANHLPDVERVSLGVFDPESPGTTDPTWLAADRPHTPRPTGHEAWVGESDRVLFSTGADGQDGNLWVVGVDDDAPRPVTETPPRYGHVGVSHCGRYWVGDATGEPGVPIHVGSVETGERRRVVTSQTEHDGEQWSHTHPYLTADSRWLVFNSTRAGHPQVFAARLPEGLLADLSPGGGAR